jgi:hypothetical protein
MLWRDEICDIILELSDVGELTCNKIFKQFLKNFVVNFKDKYLPVPISDNIRENMLMYS